MKDIQLDGLKKTTFSTDEKEKKIVIKHEVNIDPHLKHNKRLFNDGDGYSKSRDLKSGQKNMTHMVMVIGLLYQKKFKAKY
jgi:hypothetical protein